MSKKVIRTAIIVLSSILLVMLVLIGFFVYRQNSRPPPSAIPDAIETPEPTAGLIEVESITILLENNDVVKGTRIWPDIIIHPENATNKLFDIYSDNESVLRSHGRLWLALDIGTANLVVSTSNGVTARVKVTVTAPPLESLTFFDDEITLNLGDSIRLSPILIPNDAVPSEPIVYTTSNQNVVTVAGDGRITAVDAGTATITATSGDISSDIKVTVSISVRSINILLARRVYSIGDQVEFALQIVPENATNASVEISFSGAAVTSTGENRFRCDAAGEVTITANAGNRIIAEATITVLDLDILADEVHRLTNLERSNAGLPPFMKDPPLTQTALVRAGEIITYFSHTRPDGRDPFTAFTENNVQFTQAGENLAAGQRTAAEVVKSWMDSPGHKENIVNLNFGRLGVGVTMDNDGRIYWTQTFAD